MVQNEEQMMFELQLVASDLEGVDISLSTLYDIYKDYLKNKNLMEQQAEHYARVLNHCPQVNSVKWRVKDPTHLIDKIIRKRKEPEKSTKYANIDVGNYKEIINDLIGLRAIFIFKAHWSIVDEYIFKTLRVCPDNSITIYHASDDNLAFFVEDSTAKKDEGLVYTYKLEQKESRYRSTHYILRGEKYTGCKVELQVRSILDEAWGEIDHFIRYPNNQDEPELLRKMSILNGQISGCEEHASHSYAYFNKLETAKLENIANLEKEGKPNDSVEENSITGVHIENSENKKSSVSHNNSSIKVLQDSDLESRLRNIIKSTYPHRGFEGFDNARFSKQMEALNRAVDSGSLFARLSKAVDPERVNKLYQNSIYGQADALSKTLGSDSLFSRLNASNNLTAIDKLYSNPVFSQLDGISKVVESTNNDEDTNNDEGDDDSLDSKKNDSED